MTACMVVRMLLVKFTIDSVYSSGLGSSLGMRYFHLSLSSRVHQMPPMEAALAKMGWVDMPSSAMMAIWASAVPSLFSWWGISTAV